MTNFGSESRRTNKMTNPGMKVNANSDRRKTKPAKLKKTTGKFTSAAKLNIKDGFYDEQVGAPTTS